MIKRRNVVVIIAVAIMVLLYARFDLPLPLAEPDKHSDVELPIFKIAPVNYEQQVKPVLEKRCIVCHGCYDAPCQLKLSSIEGLQRGATEVRIYEPRRIKSIPPSRLFIDEKTTEAWRKREFFPVVNEADDIIENNLRNSVLYHLLQLKKANPQPQTEKLSNDFTLSLNRDQTCPSIEKVGVFKKEHPLWGMPYAMPNLTNTEYQNLVSWIAHGSKVPLLAKPTVQRQMEINSWESFLNETSNKQKLVSRYLYEHLFHAHLHFKVSSDRQFYRLVRSTTPTGQAIDEIATLRPHDDPGVNKFYYRLLPYHSSIVAKNHIVYELSEQRMKRFRTLFLTPEYNVTEPPSYAPTITSNPFKVFAAIPAVSRYRFMLDDAHFFIQGFIKGPVCRGQLALNVIEDQFWVVFFNPDKPIITNNSEFIEKMAPELALPDDFDNKLDLLRIWTEYWKKQRRYMKTKQAWFKKMGTHKLDHAMDFIWDGDNGNPNAALTVFRHFDSGSVSYGLVGDEPETTWVIDFPLLERIHYLLVADFNVFGNVGHRMGTRIYMDFLRMEGEDSFLAFLPVDQRKAIRDKWYIGQRSSIDKLFSAPQEWLSTESVSDYQTATPQKEFYQRIKSKLKDIHPYTDSMNSCGTLNCSRMPSNIVMDRADRAMKRIATLQGEQLHAFPDVAFVRIKADSPENDLTYSLIRNKAYKNVTSFLADERERDRADIQQDTMTVVKWLEGSYPNFFFSVSLSDIDEFSRQCASIRTSNDYNKFVEKYGVRRTNPEFWEMADWFQDKYKQTKPIVSGVFDLNRYQNH